MDLFPSVFCFGLVCWKKFILLLLLQKERQEGGEMLGKRPFCISDVFWLATCMLLCLMAVAAAYETRPEDGLREHKCVHDEVAIPYNALPYTDVTYRSGIRNMKVFSVFMTAARENIRFHVIFILNKSCSGVGQFVPNFLGNGVRCTADDILTPNKIRTIKIMVKKACNYLERAILVDPLDEINVIAESCPFLGHSSLRVTEKDYVLFVTANPRSSARGVIAWAHCCERISTGRPSVGHVNFIPSSFGEYATEKDIHVAMHEITHALGFTDLATNAKSHVGPGGKVVPGFVRVLRPKLGKAVTLVTSPKVVEVARKHFGCPTLDGVEIEDGGKSGTAGSHWKKRILYEEALVGSITSANLFYSSFTLAYLEDLGYYSINYSMAEDNFRWGRNRSCRFLYNKCNDQDEDVDEFCFGKGDAKKTSCTHDFLGMGSCDIMRHNAVLPVDYRYFTDPRIGGSTPLMDYCPSVQVYSNWNCISEVTAEVPNFLGNEMGQHSRCFSSNLVTGASPFFSTGFRCFPTVCTKSGQILLRVQGQTVPCPLNGTAGEADTSHLRGVQGKIVCPAASLLCGDKERNVFSESFHYSSNMIEEPVTADTKRSASEFTKNSSRLCEERVKCAENITSFFPACRVSAQLILDCFGKDCPLAMRMWIDRTALLEQCRHPKLIAELCLDGWMGAHLLCAIASSTSAATATYFPIIVVCVMLLAIVFF
ncbi:putative surface protease GP63 [Trypanosoma cruzi]|nr:putative surface protease GP63 [Trypanosoma cruzi]